MQNTFEPVGRNLGAICETIVFNQILAELTYSRSKFDISYFRTHSGIEVDFVVVREDQTMAIEVKANEKLESKDVRHLICSMRK